MCWKLLGVLPVMRAGGPDVTRSSAERAAAEAIWLPTTLLPRFGVQWDALDDRHLLVRYQIDAVKFEARYRIDADGRLVSMGLPPLGRARAHRHLGPLSLRG
jgi:hypothetical protein